MGEVLMIEGAEIDMMIGEEEIDMMIEEVMDEGEVLRLLEEKDIDLGPDHQPIDEEALRLTVDRQKLPYFDEKVVKINQNFYLIKSELKNQEKKSKKTVNCCKDFAC